MFQFHERDAIDQLNEGLRVFREEINEDRQAQNRVQVAVVTFGGNHEVKVVEDFVDTIGLWGGCGAPAAWEPPTTSDNARSVESGLGRGVRGR